MLQIDLNKDVLILEELALSDNEKWERNVTFLSNGFDMKLEFLLFKENNFSIPYKNLYLWLNVT